jgi:uncharacterized membrane protein
MEELFKKLADTVALGVEAGAVIIIAYGAIEAIYQTLLAVVRGHTRAGGRKHVLVQFGVWLLMGLEFELAADVVRSVISPSWTEIGQLAAIGLIRTFLNYFLEKDLKEYDPGLVSEPPRPDLEKVA